jgi:hypothetical protein
MFRYQLIIAPVLTVLAFAGSAQAEVIIRTNSDGIPEVQTSNVQVSAGTVTIRRNTRIRKKNRSRYATQATPRIYYPVVNPDRDYDADRGQTTIRSSSSSSSTVNGRTHRSTQSTTVQENGRTIIQSNTTD